MPMHAKIQAFFLYFLSSVIHWCLLYSVTIAILWHEVNLYTYVILIVYYYLLLLLLLLQHYCNCWLFTACPRYLAFVMTRYKYYYYSCQLICNHFTYVLNFLMACFAQLLYCTQVSGLPERTPGFGSTLSNKQDGHAVFCAASAASCYALMYTYIIIISLVILLLLLLLLQYCCTY